MTARGVQPFFAPTLALAGRSPVSPQMRPRVFALAPDSLTGTMSVHLRDESKIVRPTY
jgi:hypothetical protein